MIMTTCAVYGIITACFTEILPIAGDVKSITYTEVVQNEFDFIKNQMAQETKRDMQELESLAEKYAQKGIYTPFEIPSDK